MKNIIVSTLFLICCLIPSVDAAWTLKNGRLANADEIATRSPAEHFELGCKAFEDHNWKEAARQFRVVSRNYPNTTIGQDSNYYLGISYFYLEEYEFANDAFSQYLKCVNNPQFFQETVELKFAIAEKFKNGAKRRFFGTKQLPKWAPAKSLALTIYDEVIAAVPSHEIAAQALVSKGCLLWSMKDYHECIQSFQMVIKRFPKSELTPECYLLISKVFLEQCKYEFQNPDILAFAHINLRKFKQDFPRDERIVEAEGNVLAIKEVYAKGLYDTGQFYERTLKPRASIIYYYNAIKLFPDTCVAELCRQRLIALDPNYQENQETMPINEKMCQKPLELNLSTQNS